MSFNISIRKKYSDYISWNLNLFFFPQLWTTNTTYKKPMTDLYTSFFFPFTLYRHRVSAFLITADVATFQRCGPCSFPAVWSHTSRGAQRRKIGTATSLAVFLKWSLTNKSCIKLWKLWSKGSLVASSSQWMLKFFKRNLHRTYITLGHVAPQKRWGFVWSTWGSHATTSPMDLHLQEVAEIHARCVASFVVSEPPAVRAATPRLGRAFDHKACRFLRFHLHVPWWWIFQDFEKYINSISHSGGNLLVKFIASPSCVEDLRSIIFVWRSFKFHLTRGENLQHKNSFKP